MYAEDVASLADMIAANLTAPPVAVVRTITAADLAHAASDDPDPDTQWTVDVASAVETLWSLASATDAANVAEQSEIMSNMSDDFLLAVIDAIEQEMICFNCMGGGH